MYTLIGILLLIIGIVYLNKSLDYTTHISYAFPMFMIGFFTVIIGMCAFIYGISPVLSLVL